MNKKNTEDIKEMKNIKISKDNFEYIVHDYGIYNQSFDNAIDRLIIDLRQSKEKIKEIQRKNAKKLIKKE
jgi:hypothetical protein